MVLMPHAFVRMALTMQAWLPVAPLLACSADHTRKFLDFLEDKDITWELYPLKNVTDVQQVSAQFGVWPTRDRKSAAYLGHRQQAACI